MRDLAIFLLSHARRQGKTYHLATLCKSIGASLLVRDATEARRIEREFGIMAFPIMDTERLRGRHMGILYVDPDAAGVALNKLCDENELLRAECRAARGVIGGYPTGDYPILRDEYDAARKATDAAGVVL